MRYVKQRDKSSCGPVAIMNVLKWAGYKFSYEKTIGLLRDACGWRPAFGTKQADFDRGLRGTVTRFGINVRRVYCPRIGAVEDHLREGGIVIVNYLWRNKKRGEHRHFMILSGVSDSGKMFTLLNDNSKGQAIRRERRASVKKNVFRFQRTDPHFKAWFISRPKEEVKYD